MILKMGKEENIKWYLRPISVVLLLFFVLGPFGLPLLYKSPKFSRKLKIVLTIVVIIYTTYLIIVSVEVVRKLYIQMEEYHGAVVRQL
jgi:hypothetical protein